MIDRRIKIKEVCDMVALGKTKVYELIKQENFPAQRKQGRMSYWLLSEIQNWIKENAQVNSS